MKKNNEPLPDPQLHLVCYEIIEDTDPAPHKVLVQNQFGDLTIKVQRPELLCVPSKKIEVSG